MGSTPEYTKKAIEKYNAKFERIAGNVPKGTKDRISAAGYSTAAFIAEAVSEKLERIENI